ncbi:MAG: ECF-type sigma factor [Bryobacteraceae bacterium]
MPTEGTEVTTLLQRWQQGDSNALEQLAPMVLRELRAMAASYLRSERSEHTLQPTALVSEVFLRIMQNEPTSVENRARFFGFASRLMRNILVDHARQRMAQKRGSGGPSVTLADSFSDGGPKFEVIALHETLDKLGQFDERKARIIEMKYFGGLTFEQIVSVTGLSNSTVQRDLRTAEAWIKAQMRGEPLA